MEKLTVQKLREQLQDLPGDAILFTHEASEESDKTIYILIYNTGGKCIRAFPIWLLPKWFPFPKEDIE